MKPVVPDVLYDIDNTAIYGGHIMSYDIGRQIIMELAPAPRVGRTEYCFSYPSLVQDIVGINPDDDYNKAMSAFYDKLDFDFLWNTYDGPVWQGRTTSMGHAVYAEGGVDRNDDVHCPFDEPEEVLAFRADAEYGLPDIAERSQHFQQQVDAVRKVYPNQFIPGGYYKSIVSGAIECFGWEMLLLAQATDPKQFGEEVLEGIFQVSLANYKAWAETDIEAFICHDDMVWTEGAIFKPDFYREYIFPRYKQLWSVLREKGKKVIYCSDANYTQFIDDIAVAGADGFIMEPMTSLEYICEKYGQTHVMVGNADTRILTWGTKDQIEAEVVRCMKASKDCPGFIMAVGNHIPSNVPIDNAKFYFDTVDRLGRR